MEINLSNNTKYNAELVIWDNWQGKGYRLYWGNPVDDFSSGVQVDGEINGRVFSTIKAARAYGRTILGQSVVHRR